MTITTLATATTAQTRTEIRDELLSELAAEGADAAGFGPYSMQRLLVERHADAEARHQALRVDVTNAGFPDTAGAVDLSWLDRVIKGLFQIDREPALKAVHRFRLTNTSSGGPFTLKPSQSIAATASGLLFRNSNEADATLLAGNGQTLDLEYTCLVGGITGNIAPGDIAKLVTGLPGVTIANLTGSLITAGADEETGDHYLARAKSRWGTLGYGGSASAYLYLVSQAAPSVTRVGVRDDNPFGAGTVGVYLANSAGPATVQEVADVVAYLAPLKALGFPVPRVAAAVALLATIAGSLTTDGTNGAAETQATDALARLAATYPIGSGTLYLEKIRHTLMSVGGAVNCVLSLPSADITVAADEVLTIDAGALDVT